MYSGVQQSFDLYLYHLLAVLGFLKSFLHTVLRIFIAFELNFTLPVISIMTIALLDRKSVV